MKTEYKIPVEIDCEINELFAKIKVTQKIKIFNEKIINLKVYIDRHIGKIKFSSFSGQIGNLIKFNSKVTNEFKVEENYIVPISSENTIIYVSQNLLESSIKINFENLPPNEELILITEFIQFIKNAKTYEFILFTKYPSFYADYYDFKNDVIRGKILIKAMNEIIDVKKEIFLKNLEIIEEKYPIEDNKSKYLITYKIPVASKREFYFRNINPSKIYFDVREIENNRPIIYTQKSSLNQNQRAYVIRYKENIKKDNLEVYPTLFIFLIEKSSYTNEYINDLFGKTLFYLQCLPSNSYYQIIGFGSKGTINYDETPKKYTKKNIVDTMEIIKSIQNQYTFYFGGANLYDALLDIYENSEVYDKLKIPKNIFILTNGNVSDKSETLDILQKHSQKFNIFSIGIGEDANKDFIEKAGSLGKGGFNFCSKIEQLRNIIVNEINKAIIPYISNFNIKSSLDDNYLIKYYKIPEKFRKNKLIKIGYIVEEDKIKTNDKIKLDLEYYEKENIKNNSNYEITPIEIPIGEELFKLLISKYISSNDLTLDKKGELSIKYQFLTYYSSLYVEMDEPNIISDEYLKIVKQKINNEILDEKKSMEKFHELLNFTKNFDSNKLPLSCSFRRDRVIKKIRKPKNIDVSLNNKVKNFNNSINPSFDTHDIFKNINNENDDEENIILTNFVLNIIKGKKIDLNDKDNKKDIRYIIYTQDFIKGFWGYNDLTKLVKEKYEKEYEILKKSNNDKVCMTILIIYAISKDYPEFLDELSLIFKKAKYFIFKETSKTYEEIIKEEGLN